MRPANVEVTAAIKMSDEDNMVVLLPERRLPDCQDVCVVFYVPGALCPSLVELWSESPDFWPRVPGFDSRLVQEDFFFERGIVPMVTRVRIKLDSEGGTKSTLSGELWSRDLAYLGQISRVAHHALSYEMGDIDRRSILEVYTHLHGGRVETSFGKLPSVHPDRDSNLSFPVIDSLVYCKNSTLDYAGTEVELRCIIVLLALAYAAVETEARTVVDQPRVIGQPFSLEEIIGGVFSQRGFRGTWVSGTEFLYADSVTGDILRYDVTTGTNATLVLKEVLTAYNAGGYTLSPDGLYLLLSYDTQSGFRHSTTSKFVIYDIENSVYSNVSGTSYLQLARWSPRGSALVFVLDNNIFYRPDASNETQHQITRTGEPGVYYNGVPDWVYEGRYLTNRRFTRSSFTYSYVRSNYIQVIFKNKTQHLRYTRLVSNPYFPVFGSLVYCESSAL
uniref:Dipeptidylpeptidase IV N-terminal domain-containing protein n=1 Tax=Timema cristinae TaxID=61476 RepID=A0A7R9CDC7_TIMCR|nr:unnamed protein product [Timema cristinae]